MAAITLKFLFPMLDFQGSKIGPPAAAETRA